MTAADKIQAARALVAETEGHHPGPYRMGGPTGAGWSITSGGRYVGAAMGKATTGLFLAAPALRDTVAALADLADAQAQENARLRWVLGGVRRAIDTGRNKPLMIWRDQINIALGDAP